MRFGNPDMLWFLLAVPVLAWLLAKAVSYRRIVLLRFANTDALAKTGIVMDGHAQWARPIVVLLAVSLLVLASARPQWGFEDRQIITRGVDVMVAMDSSTSMLAQDYKPNRLERARNTLQNIIWDSKGDRIGVVAFAGSAAIVCPLTLDYRMAEMSLAAIEPNTISTKGTNLVAAIKAAINGFEMAGPGDKVLVLLTDGEHHGQVPDVIAAADEAEKNNITIHAIGIGSEDGSVIPTGSGFKKDDEGKVVQSRLDFETLTKVATMTGGLAVKAGASGAADVSSIMAAIKSMKGRGQQDKSYRVYHERFPWFLGAGLLLLLGESVIGKIRLPRRLRSRRGAAGASAAAALVVVVLSQTKMAEGYPGQTHVLSRKGLQSYNQKDFENSAHLYGEAASREPNNPLTHFNQGAALARLGKDDAATSAFSQVYDPENPQLNASALYNATTLEHQELRKKLEEKKAELEKAAPAGDEKAIQELSQQVNSVEEILENYRKALLDSPSDPDIKTNFEIALRDRNELLNMLNQEQQQNQQQEKQQQPQQQQNQDEQKQGKGQQENEDKTSDQGDKGEPSQQQQKSGEGEQENQDEQKPGDKPESGKDQQQPAPEPDKTGDPEDQKKQGEGEPEQDKSDKDGQEKPESGEQKAGEGKPQPTPGPSPTPSPTPGTGAQANAGKGKGEPGGEPQPALGEMSQNDVDRLLNTLPPEDQRAIQRLLNNNFPNPERPEKDW